MDRILILWLSVFGIHLTILLFAEFEFHNSFTEVIAKTIVLLHGPILWVYALKIFDSRAKTFFIYHLLPFLIILISGFVFYENQRIVWENILLIIKLISILSYPIYSIFWLSRRNNLLRNESSNNIVLEMNWIKTLAFLLLFSFIASLLFVAANQIFEWNLNNNFDMIIYVIMITIMGYYGLKLGIVFNQEITQESKPHKASSYKHSPLNNEKLSKIKHDIELFFIKTEEYTNPNFSMSHLSKKLNVPKHHLSQVINVQMQTTFYDIINTKRVEYVKREIIAKKDLKITFEALGYDAGFNTKAAFYFHFKKNTGKTPGQFKRQMSID
ncbi:helix-turn-helix domain-containing protein [Croceitalea marina]|uniref:Helix-turn-helix domain-containing protein n=1 Tax=Croceitalea marina TaxID=1775166 RepID=A0ABW5N0I4_9FLAO